MLVPFSERKACTVTGNLSKRTAWYPGKGKKKWEGRKKKKRHRNPPVGLMSQKPTLPCKVWRTAEGWQLVSGAGGRLLRFIYVSFHFDSFAYIRKEGRKGGRGGDLLATLPSNCVADTPGSRVPASNRRDFSLFFFFFFFLSHRFGTRPPIGPVVLSGNDVIAVCTRRRRASASGDCGWSPRLSAVSSFVSSRGRVSGVGPPSAVYLAK